MRCAYFAAGGGLTSPHRTDHGSSCCGERRTVPGDARDDAPGGILGRDVLKIHLQ